MHPFVARIHPSFRTALFAWLMGRSALYIAMSAMGFALTDTVSSSDAISIWLDAMAEVVTTHVDAFNQPGEWLRFAINELAVLMGLIGLYRFVRRDAMPQGADRAVWFAAVSPLMIYTLPGNDWAIIFALCMWALELTALSTTAIWGALLYLVALVIRPELVVLWPGMAMVAWRGGSSDNISTWVASLLPLVAFSARVMWEVLWGNPRTLYSHGSQWRTEFAWSGLDAHLADLGILAVVVVGLILAINYAGRRPKAWLALAIPCLLWPILQQPSAGAIAVLLVAGAPFGHLGAFTEDAGRERLVLAASLVGLVALATI